VETFLRQESGSKRIRVPLGAWFEPPTYQWRWFYVAEEARLYHREGLLWRVFSKTSTRSTRNATTQYKKGGVENKLPSSGRRATVTRQGDIARMSGVERTLQSTPEPAVRRNLSLEERVLSLPTADQWAIKEFFSIDDGRNVAAAIIQGTAKAVSDGSFKDEFGTSAFVVIGSDNSLRVGGVNAVPGSPQEKSPYRAELVGISGVISIVKCVCEQYDIQAGTIEMGLDGEQAMKAAFEDWPLNPAQPDFDLLSDIRAKLAKSKITWKWRWIRGHQDDNKAFKDLDKWAQWNTEVDNIAKAYWVHLVEAKEEAGPQKFGDEGWCLWSGSAKLSRASKSGLYSHVHNKRILAYWTQKERLTASMIQNIDWNLCARAMLGVPFGRRRWVTKHAVGMCGVGKFMLRWKQQNHAECPRCGIAVEDSRHVTRCQDGRAIVAWLAALDSLDLWMRKSKAYDGIRIGLLLRLKEWQQGAARTPVLSRKWNLQAAFAAQDNIGWDLFMEGCVSTEWARVQQHYLTWMGSRKTGKRWVTTLITKLWEVSWSMWDNRNDVLYNSITPRKQMEIDEVNEEIRQQYAMGCAELKTTDQRSFAKDKEDMFLLELAHKKKWLVLVKLARTRPKRLDRTQQVERIGMRRWLHQT
jgi:hypothetical protein